MQSRLLQADEWEKLLEWEPFKSYGLPDLTAREQWQVIVVEDEGRIVAISGMFNAIHWDLWQVAPDYQRNPAVIRSLIREGRQLLLEHDIPQVHAIISADAPEILRSQALRLGLKPAPGQLYWSATADLTEA